MTFRRQVWHLVRRDLVRAAPWLALTAVVLVIATARAIESRVIASGTLPTYSAILLCVTMISALIVVVDSPVRSDAFWATQPIDAGAMALAKCIVALSPVVMCAASVFFVLHDWGYSVVAASVMLGVAMSTLAIWALGIAVVAAICARRTVAWFAVGSAASVGLIFGNGAVPSAEVGVAGWGLGTLTSVAAGALMLAWLYRRRPTVPWARSAALFVGVLLLALSALNVSVASSRAAAVTQSHTPSVALRVPLTAQPECDARWLVIPVEVSSSPWAKVDLTKPTVKVTLDSGDSLSLENPEWMQSAGLWGPLVSPTRIGHLADDEPVVGERRVRRIDIAFDIPEGQQHRICGRVVRVALRLDVRTAAGEELMQLPLVTGAVASAPGLRARVVYAGRGDVVPKITVGLSSLGGRSGAKDTDVAGLEFALVERDGGAVFRMENRATEGWIRTADLPGLSRASGVQHLVLDSGTKLGDWTARPAKSLQVVVTASVWGARTVHTVAAAVPSPLTATINRTDGGQRK